MSKKKRKLKPKYSKTTTNPVDTAFKKGEHQAREGYQLVMPRYKTIKEQKAHYKGYAEGTYNLIATRAGFGLVN